MTIVKANYTRKVAGLPKHQSAILRTAQARAEREYRTYPV